MEVSPVSMNISAKVKKNMGKIHIRKDCPNIYALITLFHSYLAGKSVLSFRKKAFFLSLSFFLQLDL